MVHLLYFIQVYLLLIWARVTYISEPVKGIKINFMGRGGGQNQPPMANRWLGILAGKIPMVSVVEPSWT